MSSDKAEISEHENLKLGDLGPRLSRLGWAICVVFLGASVAWGLVLGDGMRRFMHSLVLGFAYVLTFALGALFFVVLHHLVKARWSVVVRRLAEAMTHSFKPLFLVGLVIGVTTLSGYTGLFRWSAPMEEVKKAMAPAVVLIESGQAESAVAATGIENPVQAEEELERQQAAFGAHEHGMHAKHSYLNAPFFFARILLYFFIWIGIARYFWKRSTKQDEDGEMSHTNAMRKWSAPCIILFAFTTAFMSYDILMSLEPSWFSTMFGVYYFAGCAVSIYALLALFGLLLRSNGRLKHSISVEHYHDMGKLMFAFVFFWGYVAFSQFMLIWYANIPEETFFFEYRWHNMDWKVVSLALIAVHFVLPFPLLMSRHSKRTLPVLALFALWILAAHWLDMYWLVLPNFDWFDHSFVFHPMDVMVPLGLVGMFVASTAGALKKVNLIPTKDPDLGASLKFENI